MSLQILSVASGIEVISILISVLLASRHTLKTSHPMIADIRLQPPRTERASLRAVADLLGHSSLQMVMRYAHLAPSHSEYSESLMGHRHK